ncbi:helix-turn-helix domain-containing protein [Streptomyces sp. NPDC014724]|uniref:helix-turn-helix domain-containing protein n=1 Tax=Streptomyces sp. NPDC014724 TaxID=3364882 RepID=UPI0036FD5D60
MTGDQADQAPEAGKAREPHEQRTGVPDTPVRETVLSDPRALRAYAHPTRMRLVGMLRREGPSTATRAAELIGESVASCSYHLRMLAKYGLVEQAGGGQGREKPWRAVASYTSWPAHSDDTAVDEAAVALSTTVAELYFERLTRAMEQRHRLPREWREAEEFGDHQLYLTAGELVELRERIRELLGAYDGRNDDPALRPEGARIVEFLRIAHVAPEDAP